MMILVWFLLRAVFVAAAVFLALSLIRYIRNKEGLRILLNGILNGWRRWGFTPRRYPVELYKWVTADDGEVCEDCLDRAQWPPMDIADWMKEGMPGTPEAHTHCCEPHAHQGGCRCQLVLVLRHIPAEREEQHP